MFNACVNFSDVSLLLVDDCGAELNALATAVKLCKIVLCKRDVKSIEGVGFEVAVVVVVVADDVELAAAAVDNWLISLFNVSLASRFYLNQYLQLIKLS